MHDYHDENSQFSRVMITSTKQSNHNNIHSISYYHPTWQMSRNINIGHILLIIFQTAYMYKNFKLR